MFDYLKFYNRILLISGICLLVYGIMQPTGDTIFGARVFLGTVNLIFYLLSFKFGNTLAQKILICELYLFTPYLLYQNFIVEENAYLMVFSTIIFFSGSFLFLNSKENLIYLLFNGVNLFMYVLVSDFSKESIITSFLFLTMYLFAYNIHRAFLSSIKNLRNKENDLKERFFWMTHSIESPLTKINGLIDIFEINDQVETVKIEKQISEIKEQLIDLESKFKR